MFCLWMGLTRFFKIIDYGEKEKRTLYTDNFYASVTFAKEIRNRETGLVATLKITEY